MLLNPATDAALDAAIAHHEAGRIDLAEAAYRAILIDDPDEPDALNLLGLILQNQGHHPEAIELIARALEIDPEFPEALTNLARGKRATGDTEAAAMLATRAVNLDPDLPEAQLQLGQALLDQMRGQEALAPLQQAVSLDPGLIDAHIALGNARMSQHDFAAAARAFEAAVAIDPDRLEALVNFGACLLKLDRMTEALAHQRHAAEVAPKDPVPYAAIGSTLRQLGDIPGSIEACLRAVALAPGYHDVLIVLGNNYISLGNFDQADTIFREALAVSRDSGSARAGLAAIGRGSAEDAEIDRLAKTMIVSTLSDHERVAAGFALGSILDQNGRYDEAFSAFVDANDFLRAIRQKEGRRYDPKMAKRHAAWAKITFTPELFVATKGLGNSSDRPVFIVGMPRSGTTLVEQIVASHPRVFGAGELPAMPAMISALDGGPSHISPRQWDRERIAALTESHVAELAALNASAVRVTDKLPDNVQLLGQIAVLYPNARVILCRRDLRDVCLSCYFQYFGSGNDWSFDLGDTAFRAGQIEELIAHWRKVLPLPILEVDYETLIGDLEGQSRRLLTFLGLDWDEGCLDFHRTERQVLTASHWQVRQPLYATSIGRWRHYQTHIGSLLEDLRGLLPDDGEDDASGSPDVATMPGLSGAEVLTDLAAVHLSAKAPEAALQAARRAVAADRHSPVGHFLVGVSLMELDQTEAAIEPLREALRLAPEWFSAWSNLASALSRLKDYAAAVEVWKQALALNPDNIDCLLSIATVLVELGQLPAALNHLNRAATSQPNNAEIQGRIAAALLVSQDAQAAEIPARRAVRLEPDQPGHMFGLAECLSALGQFDEAAVYFRRAAERAPNSARAQFGLTKIGETLTRDTDIPRLREILADPTRHIAYRSDAGFALARALQADGDYDSAFETFAIANRLAAARSAEQGRRFDIQQFRREVDALIAWFTPAKFSIANSAGNASELPVFIVGMPRSGTTLVEQIAASHPQVFGRGETKTITMAMEALNGEALRRGGTVWLPSETAAKGTSIIEEMRSAGGDALRITDKMPDNILYLGQIAMLLSKARIIMCRRDLRDIGTSCFFESFTDGMEWTTDLRDIGARAYEIHRLMVHWRHVLPLPILEIQYEDLVADLEGQSRRLIQFLGLDWDPACLSFHTTQRQIMTASHWQVRQPLYSSSVGRWRHYQRHLGPMIDAMRGLVTGD